jgi:two-component system nitrate/nitrite response regulator NarL
LAAPHNSTTTVLDKHRRVRVLVGDDHPLFLEAMARAIKGWPEFEFVGAVDANGILQAMRDHRPDVAVLDPTPLDREVQDEIFACAREGIQVVFISNEGGPATYEAIEQGALGCLTRASSSRELCHAVAAVARGDAYLAPAATPAIAAELRLRNRLDGPYLSKRQRQVLTLVAQGLTNKQVAEALVISEATVKSHLRTIYKTLGAKSRPHAIAEALRHKLID